MLNLHLLECTLKGYDHISDLLLAKYWVIIGCKYCDCTSLTYIACLAGTPPEINYNAFDQVDTSIPLYVPAGSVEAYKKATYWDMFNNIIGIEAGIENPECATQNSAIIYDLTGRRVENPTKGGIYIIGGKKVIIK